MFEVQKNLSGQLDPFLVHVFDGHQVALRGATEDTAINPQLKNTLNAAE